MYRSKTSFLCLYVKDFRKGSYFAITIKLRFLLCGCECINNVHLLAIVVRIECDAIGY